MTPLLRGMVLAGLGIEALCAYLGLTRDALDAALVYLDLPTPHDRALRAPGPRGWTVEDTHRLIAWRLDGVHPADMAARFGRSRQAIYARCRRLGIPSPGRAKLHRRDAGVLEDPPADLFACGLVLPGDRPAAPVPPPPRPAFPPQVFVPRPAAPAAPLAPPLPVPVPERQPTLDIVAKPAVRTKAGKAPKPAGDLAWVSGRQNWRRCREVIEALVVPYFGGQHHVRIAERAGITPAALQSFWHRVEMPRDRHRSRFSEAPNDEIGRQRLAASGYRLETCGRTGNFFFKHARDAGVRVCRKLRFETGKLTEWDRYKSQEMSLA